MTASAKTKCDFTIDEPRVLPYVGGARLTAHAHKYSVVSWGGSILFADLVRGWRLAPVKKRSYHREWPLSCSSSCPTAPLLVS